MADSPTVRVLVCPDKFAGTLSAIGVAEAVAAGWLSVAPADDIVVRPLADGGPGFLDVVSAAVGGTVLTVPTTGPLGAPATGQVLMADGLVAGEVAYVESAQACGLDLVLPADRDPRAATTYGLGALVATAVEAGAREIVIGLGGSATNDGGAGLLAALGAAPVDAAGYVLPHGGAALVACTGLTGEPRLRGARLVAATDVDSPLTGLYGASAVFGPQKFAPGHPDPRADVLLLDAALTAYASVLERALPTCPPGLAARPGAGAAGGLGAAILACGGRVESGIGLVRRLTGFDAVLESCDLVITGEGSFDDQSLRGKVVAGVAGAARNLGIPCAVVAGRVEAGRRGALAAGVTESYALVEHFGSVQEALAHPAEGLRALGQRLARQWSRV